MKKGLSDSLAFLFILFLSPQSIIGQTYGIAVHNPERMNPGLHMITVPDLHMTFLMDSVGRYIYQWYYPLPELKRDFQVNVIGKILSKEQYASNAQNPNDTLVLGQGSFIVYQKEEGSFSEYSINDTLVWEYRSPFRDKENKPLPMDYVGKFNPKKFPNYIFPPPFTPKEIKQARRQVDTTGQYKKLQRETVAEIEVGYWDDAQRYLDTFLISYPEDQEALYAMTLLQTVRKNMPLALKWTQKSLEAGLPLSRFTADLHGMLSPLLQHPSFGELKKDYPQNLLLHGPMLGNVTDTSFSVWLRTEGGVEVQIKCFDDQGVERGVSEPNSATKEVEYTLIANVSGLDPGKTYGYEVWIAGKKIGQRHTFQTAHSKAKPTLFSLGFSGGAGYTPRYERMWDTLSTHELDLFLLLGDNVYIDHPERPATQKYCYYRRQSRPEYQRFTAKTPIYAIWDDHDFTYNDDRGGPAIDEPYWKPKVWEVFKNQWVNPYYGGGEEHPGCYMDFSKGDVDFFLLDCRYYREDPKKEGASMLGPIQKAWLKEKLKASKATFKVIASSVPWAFNTKPGSLDTWDGHPEEREEIFSFIEKEKIEGVLLISADRHRSDAWKIERPEGYNFYDLMSSKLTNVHTHKVMPGSLFGYNRMCSFGVLAFDTTREDPQVQYRIYNIENEEIHRLTLYRSQFTFD